MRLCQHNPVRAVNRPGISHAQRGSSSIVVVFKALPSPGVRLSLCVVFLVRHLSQLISTSSFFALLFAEIQRTLLHLMRT